MADYFLKIDGIAGESQNPRHQGEIEVESFNWSETYLASAAGAGGSRQGTRPGPAHHEADR